MREHLEDFSRVCEIRDEVLERVDEFTRQQISRFSSAELTALAQAEIDGQRRPGHRIAHREHGTHACYVWGPVGPGKGCRCTPCVQANTDYEADRKARAVTEGPPYVSATPVREHLAMLAANGIGLKSVARLSGVSHGALSKIVHGTYQRGKQRPPTRRVRRSTQAAVLAVTPSQRSAGHRVPAGPTMERVADLVAAKVPKARIAERVGQNGGGLQIGKGTMVTARTAREVKAMHDELLAGTLVTWRTARDHRTGGVKRVEIRPAPPAREPEAVEERVARQVEYEQLVTVLGDAVLLRLDRGWQARAACRGRDPGMFFPAKDDRPMIDAALSICGACPVRERCLEENLREPEGIFGGATPERRRQVVAERRRDAAAGKRTVRVECPWCDRMWLDLARHVARSHPDKAPSQATA